VARIPAVLAVLVTATVSLASCSGDSKDVDLLPQSDPSVSASKEVAPEVPSTPPPPPADDEVVEQDAIDISDDLPEYDADRPRRQVPLEGYMLSADGKTLSVITDIDRFQHPAIVIVEQTAESVTVEATEGISVDGEVTGREGLMFDVVLDEPLGNRTVIDAKVGTVQTRF